MVYSFQLVKHANIHYREAVSRLGCCELLSMLDGLSVNTSVREEKLGGADFLTFDCRELTPAELSVLARHSTIVMMAERSGDLLRPLDFVPPLYLPEDLPEVLKYKGKTSVSFTQMMLNTVLSLTPFFLSGTPLTVLDPLCGKGTTAFCAICGGHNAVGVDLDRKDLKEAADYFRRYLKIHMLKHTSDMRSETVLRSPVPVQCFTFSDTREHFTSGDVRTLRLINADSALVSALMKRSPAHVIVADLPYGIQHAPQAGRKTEAFRPLLHRILPEWRKALRPEGAVALSFNTLTLPTSVVREELGEAGFTVCSAPIFSSLRHEVEQAVVRDVVFAVNRKGGSL